MFKRVCATITTLAIGGFVGSEAQKRLRTAKVHAASPLISNRPAEIMKYGFPSSDDIKMRENYVLSYDRRCRQANWVFEHLTKEIISITDDSVDRVEFQFLVDKTVPKLFRSSNQDFAGSGFDRGHLAAAANHRAHRQWMQDTFYLSNISPQHPKLNREAWNNLEKYVRSLCHHYDNVYVCTGPLYLPRRESDGKLYVTYQVLEPNHVAVPTHYFKVLLLEKNGKFELRSYMMPNGPLDPNIPLKEFIVPVDVIERSSGLQMFSSLTKPKIR